MRKVVGLAIAAVILASCLVDNDTIHELNQMTTGDLLKRANVFYSPLPAPTYAIPRPTLER
jgi:hypothetical protein